MILILKMPNSMKPLATTEKDRVNSPRHLISIPILRRKWKLAMMTMNTTTNIKTTMLTETNDKKSNDNKG